jgi:hypothetical protein
MLPRRTTLGSAELAQAFDDPEGKVATADVWKILTDMLTTREETLGPVAPLYARADRIFNRCAAPPARWPANPSSTRRCAPDAAIC